LLGPHPARQDSLGAFASQWAIRLRDFLSGHEYPGWSGPDSHTERFGQLQRQPPAVAELERELCRFASTTTRAGAVRSTRYHYPGGYVSLRPGWGQCELLNDTPLDRFRVGELGH